MKLFPNLSLGKAIRVVPFFQNINYYLECEDGDEKWNLYYGDMKHIKAAIPDLLKLRPNIKIQIKTYKP